MGATVDSSQQFYKTGRLSTISTNRCSVCIMGAGVIGLSIGYQLALRGVRGVVIVDRAGIGSGASAIQPGGVRQQWGSRVNCLLSKESYAFYRDVSEHLELAVPAKLDSGGYVFVALSAETHDRLERNRVLQNECGVPSVSLSPEEAGELVPGLDPSSLRGAFFCAEDGYFDRPQAVIAAFAATARAHGALIEMFDVAALAKQGSGWAVRDRSGQTILCDHLVVAAGIDSPLLISSLGVELPINKAARHLFYSDPIQERILEPLVVSPDQHFAAKQLADGSVLASDLSAEGDTTQITEWRTRVRAGIETLLPVLQYVTFPVHVEGHYDLTLDSQPILGEIDGLAGLWLATGMSGRGFMMAPAVGRVMADVIATGRYDPLLEPLSFARFDRSTLNPEPQVV